MNLFSQFRQRTHLNLLMIVWWQKRPAQYNDGAEASADVTDPRVKKSGILENYSEELISLTTKTPDIEVKFMQYAD